MIPRLAALSIGLALLVATTTARGAATQPTTAAVAVIGPIHGKVIKIWHELDLTGAGKPSPLHTEYVTMLLQQEGATVVHVGSFEAESRDKTKPNIVIFGQMSLPQFTPEDLRDPFIVAKKKQQEQTAQRYAETLPKLQQDAAAAGARVIKSNEAGAALGLRDVTDAQIKEALNARTRDLLKRLVPELKANALKLSDVVDFLRDVAGANIFVNWRALEVAGVTPKMPITLELGETPLGEALDKLLEQAAAGGGKGAKLGYTVDEGVITISTADDVNRK